MFKRGDDKPRLERDEVDPNIVYEVFPDGSRRRFRPTRQTRSRYEGFENWLNTKTGETFFGPWPPPWLEEKDKRRRGIPAFARGIWERLF
jgi:hypothetical protein